MSRYVTPISGIVTGEWEHGGCCHLDQINTKHMPSSENRNWDSVTTSISSEGLMWPQWTSELDWVSSADAGAAPTASSHSLGRLMTKPQSKHQAEPWTEHRPMSTLARRPRNCLIIFHPFRLHFLYIGFRLFIHLNSQILQKYCMYVDQQKNLWNPL